jgi:hypothetical protein
MRRRFSYANVAATLALVFSMSSGALAAKHYLITSTKQIKPSVLKQLRGRTGTTGAKGATGSGGPQGAQGAVGPEGKAGLAASELETLRSILPHMRYVASGVGGKPTVQLSGVNVQLVNGEGNTATTNGVGNLVIGYDEAAGHAQTGSHDLVLGERQTFTSFGGIVAGSINTISAPGASVTGGFENSASGTYASVSGGAGNLASGYDASIGAGFQGLASANYSSISGGTLNKATGTSAWLGGGFNNTAAFLYSSVLGGKEHATKADYETIP